MKKLKYIIGLSLLTPALFFAPVLALGAESGSDSGLIVKNTTSSRSNTATSYSTKVASNETTQAANDASKTTLVEPDDKDTAARTKRLDDIKTALKTKLSEDDKKRIVQKCKSAQNFVGSEGTNDKSNGVKRIDIYKKIDSKLDELTAKLKSAGRDTSALEADKLVLDLKIATFTKPLHR